MTALHFSLSGRASLITAREFAVVAGQVLRSWRVPEPRAQALELAVAEMASNVCRHGYRGDESGSMRLALDWDDGGLRVALCDRGVPFDPRTAAPAREPDESDPATWPEGGMGLAFIRAAGQLQYRSDEQGNELCLTVAEPLP